MTGIRFVILLLAGILATACGKPAPLPYSGPAQHVIFISLDTTRRDHMGFYGNPWIETPHLDALAADSIVFDDFMTVVPTTLASHTSLFTGKYPQNHGVPRNGFVVDAENLMLTEILRDHGFYSAAFFGSFAISGRTEFPQGFDHVDEGFTIEVGDAGADQNQRTAGEVTDAVIGHLEGIERPQNLFLFAHYFDPHDPYDPPEPFRSLYPPLDPETGERREDVYVCADALPAGIPAAYKNLAMLYAGEISYTDHEVGRLLAYLDEAGYLENAMVVLTTDHGERFWEKSDRIVEHARIFDHGLYTYESTIQAAGLIRLPGGRHAGARVGSLVANIDIFPSVLRYLNLPIPEDVDGEAFDLERPESFEGDRIRFAQATKPTGAVEEDLPWLNMRKDACIRSGRYKYIHSPYRDTEELYDLTADPCELNDLLKSGDPAFREIADDLGAALREWIESADPKVSRFASEDAEDTRRRLEALGYL